MVAELCLAAMAELQRADGQPAELQVKKQNRRVEQKDDAEDNNQEAASVREFDDKLEGTLQKIYDGILVQMDENLIPSASVGNVVPCGDMCAPVPSQNVQISGSVADKILRVIEKNRAEKYLEMFTDTVEKNDDHEKFYEQFGECSNPGNREDSTIGAKIAELLRVNASKSEDEQLSLKECVDRMNGDPNDIYSIIGESIAAVFSFVVLGILR